MLNSAGNAARDVELRRHRLAGLTDLVRMRDPARVDRGARGTDGTAERAGERLDDVEVLRTSQPTSAGHDDAGLIDWSRAAVDSSFARAFGGVEGSGPNPTDRGRPGVKQHVMVDGQGIPLAGDVSAANVPEVKELLPLADSAGPLDEGGEPKQRPEKMYGDRAYDSEPHREELRARGIDPELARRYTEHGSGLGKYRWVVERFFSWLHGFRKLRFVTEKDQEMQFAFFNLGLALICFRFLEPSFS